MNQPAYMISNFCSRRHPSVIDAQNSHRIEFQLRCRSLFLLSINSFTILTDTTITAQHLLQVLKSTFVQVSFKLNISSLSTPSCWLVQTTSEV